MVAKYRKKYPKFDKFVSFKVFWMGKLIFFHQKGEDAFAIAEALKQLNIEQLKSEWAFIEKIIFSCCEKNENCEFSNAPKI